MKTCGKNSKRDTENDTVTLLSSWYPFVFEKCHACSDCLWEVSPLFSSCLVICSLILGFSRLPASDMPFSLVFLKNDPHLVSKLRTDFHQSFSYVFVNSAFADAEFFRCSSYSGFFIDNVICQFNCPLFDISLQLNIPPLQVILWRNVIDHSYMQALSASCLSGPKSGDHCPSICRRLDRISPIWVRRPDGPADAAYDLCASSVYICPVWCLYELKGGKTEIKSPEGSKIRQKHKQRCSFSVSRI